MFNSFFGLTTKKTSMVLITCLLWGNPSVAITGGFASQRGHNAESVCMSRRHYGIEFFSQLICAILIAGMGFSAYIDQLRFRNMTPCLQTIQQYTIEPRVLHCTDYRDDKWASQHLKSPTNGLFVQQPLRASTKEHQSSALLALCERNPSIPLTNGQ